MGDHGAPVLPQTLTLDHVSPATRLLEKRRQMFEVQEALDAQKEEFARREEAFRRREEGLRKKDLDLQESLIRFNKFLQENESKRTRAEKRAKEERAARDAEELNVKSEMRQLEKHKAETKKKKEELAKNRKYQLYLERVQEAHSDDYPEISNILDRYRTLKDADESLESRQRETEQKMETQRLRSSQYKAAKDKELIVSSTTIANLKKELEATGAMVAAHQESIDGARLKLREQTRELGEVLFSVENLRNRCVAASDRDNKGPTIKHGRNDDTEGGFVEPGGEGDVNSKIGAWLSSGGKETMEDLEIIKRYIQDFKIIAGMAPESSKPLVTTEEAKPKAPPSPAAIPAAGAGH